MNETRFLISQGPVPGDSIPVHIVTGQDRSAVIESLDQTSQGFASALKSETGGTLVLPDAKGEIAAVIASPPHQDNPLGALALGSLTTSLPPRTYHFATLPGDPVLACLGWSLGGYRFTRYRKTPGEQPTLVIPEDDIYAETLRLARGMSLTRDLINTPPNDMGPAEIEAAARGLSARFNAVMTTISGDDLLTQGFPLIHAVGKGSTRTPRLIDFSWGDEDAPKVTLVGKGVAFDTGGLDLKPAAGMLLMKKDMGGAANVLGLASMLMEADTPIRLRVLIPAVENSVSGEAFRPSDVYTSRKGLTVEIGNTDAEGRLVLADALALADEEAPDLLIDMATLTGAARVALGPDVPPYYTDDEGFSGEFNPLCRDLADPAWRLPLWQPYDAWVNGSTGDIDNAPGKPFAGSITAALFLARFVEAAKTWVHFDLYGWAPEARPHGPKGGEAQCIRALDGLIRARYQK